MTNSIAARRPTAFRTTVLALLLIGTVLRAAHYLHGRGLWSDEIRLAINIMGRSFASLLRPLDYDQVAPIPFLWLTRATALLAGPDGYALRLWPFIGGLLLLPIMRRLAFRVMTAGPALFATGLVALSPLAIYYSAELKPYGIDALVAAGLILVALRLLDEPTTDRRWTVLTFAGAVSVIGSTSAIVVLASIGLGLLASPEIRATRAGWIRLMTTGTVWLAAFVPAYVFVYHPGSSSTMMETAWERHFLTPSTPDLAFRAEYLARTIFGRFFFVAPVGPHAISPLTSRLISLLVLAGTVSLARRKRLAVALCVAGPIALVLLGSAARVYPLWPRLVLFTLPSTAILIAEGTWGLLGLVVRGALLLPIGLAASVLLLVPAARTGIDVLAHPIERDESARLVSTFLAQSQPTDPIYVAVGAIPSWTFYTTNWSAPDSARLAWMAALATSGGPDFLNRPSRNRAVRHEGWEQRRPLGRRIELTGIATGVTTSYIPPFRQSIADTGWADNEADRIVAEAHQRLWIFSTDLGTRQLNELRTALTVRGAREQTRYEEPGATLSCFVMEPPTSGVPAAVPAVP